MSRMGISESIRRFWSLPVAVGLILGVLLVARAGLAQTIDYDVTVEGLADTPAADLESLLRDVSALVTLQDDPPTSRLSLTLRAESDRAPLITALNSEGFWDADVVVAVPDFPDEDGLYQVTITVVPGNTYTLASALLQPVDPSSQSALIAANAGEAAGLVIGERARNADVAAVNGRVLDALNGVGHPYASIIDRVATIDRNAKTMDVVFTVDAGPAVTLGEAQVSGLEDVDLNLVFARLGWRRGQAYRPAVFRQTREDLGALDVFSSIGIRLHPEGKEIAASGQPVPVAIEVVERKRRFIGIGARFSTDRALGVRTFWGHRNLFGGGERLRVDAFVGRLGDETVERLDYDLSTRLAKPAFLRPDQSVSFGVDILQENTDAFFRRAVVIDTRLDRQFSRRLSGGVGAILERSSIDDDGEIEQDTFLGFPVDLTYDGTDDALDPTRGLRGGASVTSYPRFLGATRNFTVVRGSIAGFQSVLSEDRAILAGRIGAGSILGANLDAANLPADKRLFAGGAGSVRGFAFQAAGPLDGDDEPEGGLSVLEVSAEARLRVTDTIGIVPFIDGGGAFATTVPDVKSEMFWGAGLGLRYFTDIGPLRLDVAVPVNGRDSDDAFQIYASIGQAF